MVQLSSVSVVRRWGEMYEFSSVYMIQERIVKDTGGIAGLQLKVILLDAQE